MCSSSMISSISASVLQDVLLTNISSKAWIIFITTTTTIITITIITIIIITIAIATLPPQELDR